MAGFNKRIALIGDIGAMNTNGAWGKTHEGVVYRSGSKDTLPGLAQRFMGGAHHARALWNMQSPATKAQGFGPGAVLRVPAEMAARAEALGFVGDQPGDAEDLASMGDVSLSDIPQALLGERNYEDQVNASMTALAPYASALGGPDVDSWRVFKASWDKLYANQPNIAAAYYSVPTFAAGLVTRHETVQGYEVAMHQWADKMRAAAPGATIPTMPPPQNPNASAAEPTDWVSLIKWGVVGVGLVAGAYALGPILRSFGRK